MLGQAGEVSNIGGVIGRQAQGPDLVCKTQPAVMLHGTRLGRIGLGIESGRRFGIDQKTRDAPWPQFVGQHQSTGASTHNENFGFDRVGAFHGANQEQRTTQRSVSSGRCRLRHDLGLCAA